MNQLEITKEEAFQRFLRENAKQQKNYTIEFSLFLNLSLHTFFPPVNKAQISIQHTNRLELQALFMVIEESCKELQEYCSALAIITNIENILENPKEYYSNLYKAHRQVVGNQYYPVHPEEQEFRFTFCSQCYRFFHVRTVIHKAALRMAQELMGDGSLTKEDLMRCWRNFILCEDCPMGGKMLLNSLIVYNKKEKKLEGLWEN